MVEAEDELVVLAEEAVEFADVLDTDLVDSLALDAEPLDREAELAAEAEVALALADALVVALALADAPVVALALALPDEAETTVLLESITN